MSQYCTQSQAQQVILYIFILHWIVTSISMEGKFIFIKSIFTLMEGTLENWFFNQFLFLHFTCLRLLCYCCCYCICSVNYLCKSSVESVGCAEWLHKEVVCFYYNNKISVCFFLFLQICYINIGWFIIFTNCFYWLFSGI